MTMAEKPEQTNVNFWAPLMIAALGALLLLGWIFRFPW